MWKRKSVAAAAAAAAAAKYVQCKGVREGRSRNYSKAAAAPLPLSIHPTPISSSSSALHSPFPSHHHHSRRRPLIFIIISNRSSSFTSLALNNSSSSSSAPDIDHFPPHHPPPHHHPHLPPPEGDDDISHHQQPHLQHDQAQAAPPTIHFGIEPPKLEALLSFLKTPPQDASLPSALDNIFPPPPPPAIFGEGILLHLIRTPSLVPHSLICFFRWLLNNNSSSSSSITPSVVDALVIAAATNHTAFALWDLIKDCHVVPIRIHTLHRFISLFSKLRAADQVFEFFTKIPDFGSLPNSETYFLTISALCSSSCLDRACVVSQRMLQVGALPHDPAKLGKMIGWFCRGGRLEEAHAVYAAAKDKPMLPPFSRLRNLIRCLSNRNETVPLAVEILGDLRGDARKKATSLFSTAIVGLCRMKDVGGATLLLSKMISRGPPPGNVVFNHIVTAYSKNGDMEEAVQTMKLMESRGLKPDVYTYTAIISGYVRVGLIDEACKFLSQAKDKHHKLAPVTYHTLIRGYCNLNQFDKALELLAEMKQFGVQPNVDEYTKLVQSLCLRGLDWKVAEELVTEMEENGLHLNAITKGLVRAVRELDEEGIDRVASIEA